MRRCEGAEALGRGGLQVRRRAECRDAWTRRAVAESRGVPATAAAATAPTLSPGVAAPHTTGGPDRTRARCSAIGVASDQSACTHHVTPQSASSATRSAAAAASPGSGSLTTTS